MNRTRISFIIFAALAIFACKKQEEDTLPSLTGSLKINGVEAFISADGDSRTITVKPSGAVHPEGKDIGYYWKVSPLMTSYDTTRYENGLNKNGLVILIGISSVTIRDDENIVLWQFGWFVFFFLKDVRNIYLFQVSS